MAQGHGHISIEYPASASCWHWRATAIEHDTEGFIMNNRTAYVRLVAHGMTAVGGGVGGFGVYGLVLYHVGFAMGLATLLCGVGIVVCGLFLRRWCETRMRPTNPVERQL
jgi:hypothetical protein